jgi:hypothetical protein
MGNLERMGNNFPFPDDYSFSNTHNFGGEEEAIGASTNNNSLMMRIKNIHISFQHIGFDHGINTALKAAKENLSGEEQSFLRDRFGLNSEQLKTISYESLSGGPEKLAKNQRIVEIMNAIFIITNNDSLEEMEVTTETIIGETLDLN